MAEAEPSLDAVLSRLLAAFAAGGRCDQAHEQFRQTLRAILARSGYDERKIRLIEINLLGSLSGWMEFVLAEQAAGRNAVPDFARHLKRVFLVHCRQHQIEPEIAVQMAIELATAIMD
ncbi:MAG: hypothetical protein N3A66_01075, partial [Planctomycetota bacterium]|nr:hypothetical protein [Planctomycetota bacterium]